MNFTNYLQVSNTYKNFIDDKNEIVTEPLKYDGFCIRSLEEDIKYEEYEKTQSKKKPVGIKKK